MSWPWSELGLPGPADLRSVRQAYAQRLKTTHPEENPEGFQRLHEAYQLACRIARQTARASQPAAAPDPPDPPEAAEETAAPNPRSVEQAPDGASQRDGGAPSEHHRQVPEQPPSDWDYERLFAEGEAEAREARLRKLQELREKNRARYAAREQEQRRRSSDEAEAWAAVMAAAHALELLMSSSAPLPEWRRFLESPVFWNVRSNLDFIFALEDFLEQNPDLPQAVRREIFAAYELEKGARPEYARLSRLLNVSPREKRTLRRENSLWRRQWRSWPGRRRFATVFGAVFLGLMALISFWDLTGGIRASLGSLFSPDSAWEEQWQEHALEWLEEDFGEPFVRDGNLFAPAADPQRCFHASSYGERSEDWPGYQTNYPHILIRQALEDFAAERNLILDLGSYSGDPGDAPGAYLLELPLTGAEEDIAALGELLKDLSRQDWYQVPPVSPRSQAEYLAREPVEFTVFLCHEGLAFYDTSSSGGFDAEEALELYAQAGPAYCSYILEHSGLADRHMGQTPYMFLDQGRVEIDGGDFFWVSAADKERGLPQVHYFLSTAGTTLFCLPHGALDSLTADGLCQGTSGTITLDHIGSILVWDQVETK